MPMRWIGIRLFLVLSSKVRDVFIVPGFRDSDASESRRVSPSILGFSFSSAELALAELALHLAKLSSALGKGRGWLEVNTRMLHDQSICDLLKVACVANTGLYHRALVLV